MTLPETHKFLKSITFVEDLFPEARNITGVFRDLCKVVHPDLYTAQSDKLMAEELFKLLNEWKEKADKKVADNTWGDKTLISEITVKNRNNTYILNRNYSPGNICNLYSGYEIKAPDKRLFFKVCINPVNNSLLLAEAKNIKRIREQTDVGSGKLLRHIATLIDSFLVEQPGGKRVVNVFELLTGFCTLEDVIKNNPDGIPLASAAWMFNRLLAAMMVVSANGIVHAGIVPSNFIIHPETHNGVLVDFCYSVNPKQGEIVKVIIPEYTSHYPVEILNRMPVSPKTDVLMAAKLLVVLLGGQDKIKNPRLNNLIRACFLGMNHRISGPIELYDDFQDVLNSIFGKRKFVPFEMPKNIKNKIN